MKFARYLAVLDRDAPPRLTGKFIRYKQLKKLLKQSTVDGKVAEAQETVFFEALHLELSAANAHFQAEADHTVAAFRRTLNGRRVLCCFVSLRRAGPREFAALANQAYWCRKYARANAVALRKILKKHDKLCRNDRGRAFLQECWCSSSALGVGLFLHSPLLDELKAVQDVLQRMAQEEQDECVTAQPTEKALELAATALPSSSARVSPNPGGGTAPAPTPSIASVTSYTSPSLKAQREAGLVAIAEDPACMLDSSDMEWASNSPRAQRTSQPGSTWSDRVSQLRQWDVLGGQVAALRLPPAPPVPVQRSQVDPDAPMQPEAAAATAHGDPAGSDVNAASGPQRSAAGSSGGGLGPFSEDDLRCPICLDLLYRPVGLGCGHKFCRACALEAAGFGHVYGTFRNVISYIPARTPCPHCRQTHVYRSAVALKEVGLLIRSRFPEHWEERHMEEKRQQRYVRAASS